MDIGIVISFYDEHDIVLQTIKNIKNVYKNTKFILVHTNNETQTSSLQEIKKYADFYIQLEDLSKKFDRNSYQSRSISRNFSYGFSKIYENINKLDIVCALTGDTFINDPKFIEKVYNRFNQNNKFAAISQAIGQNFHAPDDDLKNKKEGRHQHPFITDMMPQLFLIDGNFCFKTRCFSDIKITNIWTSEQCLGDELKLKLEEFNKKKFHDNIFRLNEENIFDAYSFKEGIIYHAKNNGIPGR